MDDEEVMEMELAATMAGSIARIVDGIVDAARCTEAEAIEELARGGRWSRLMIAAALEMRSEAEAIALALDDRPRRPAHEWGPYGS